MVKTTLSMGGFLGKHGCLKKSISNPLRSPVTSLRENLFLLFTEDPVFIVFVL